MDAPRPPRNRTTSPGPRSLGELYDVHLPRVHAFVARRIWDPHVVEAVTAATFARVFGTIRRDGLGEEAVGAWLYRTASGILSVRRRSVPQPGPMAHDSEPPEPAEPGEPGWIDAPDGDATAARLLAAALDRNALSRALLALSRADQRLLVLRFLDGLEPDELCATLECSRATLAYRLRRALRTLADGALREATDAA